MRLENSHFKLAVSQPKRPQKMRFTFPDFTPEPEFIQPDYDKWTAVRVGMSRDETTALLGPPLDDRYRGGKSSPTDPYYSYGFLQMPMVPHPRTYAFLIGFGSDGKVFTKMDPFNGRFSVDGSPTVPEIIIPADETVFSHYPRIVDCRWFPSSGVYPITYTFELGVKEDRGDRYLDEALDSDLPIPFFMTHFSGAQRGRFRVRARNRIGQSDWSVYHHFKFTV